MGVKHPFPAPFPPPATTAESTTTSSTTTVTSATMTTSSSNTATLTTSSNTAAGGIASESASTTSIGPTCRKLLKLSESLFKMTTDDDSQLDVDLTQLLSSKELDLVGFLKGLVHDNVIENLAPDFAPNITTLIEQQNTMVDPRVVANILELTFTKTVVTLVLANETRLKLIKANQKLWNINFDPVGRDAMLDTRKTLVEWKDEYNGMLENIRNTINNVEFDVNEIISQTIQSFDLKARFVEKHLQYKAERTERAKGLKAWNAAQKQLASQPGEAVTANENTANTVNAPNNANDNEMNDEDDEEEEEDVYEDDDDNV